MITSSLFFSESWVINMEDIEIIKRIKWRLDNIGIQIPNLDGEVFLADYIEDSMAFMSFILEIEEEFDIEVPDEYLSIDMLESVTDAVNMIRYCIDL